MALHVTKYFYRGGSYYLLLAFLAIACIRPSLAQNDFFNTLDVDIETTNSLTEEDFSLIGWVTQKVSQGIERPGVLFSRQDRDLNKIETSLFVQLDKKLGEGFDFRISGKVYHDEVYRLDEGIDYTSDETNEFRNRFEVRDFYIEKQYNNGFYFKLGNQILAWGLAEYSRVTDLINTEDQYNLRATRPRGHSPASSRSAA